MGLRVSDGFTQDTATNDSDTDEALLQRYSMGDVVAFDELYYRHKDVLYGYLQRQLGASYADRLFQTIWLEVVQVGRGYRASTEFRQFLGTVTHRALSDDYRRHNKQVRTHHPSEATANSQNEWERLVAELYGQGDLSPSPEQLDDVILAAARREVRGSSRRRRLPQSTRTLWRMPLATAAVLVLCIGLFAQLRNPNYEPVELRSLTSLSTREEHGIPVAKLLSPTAASYATSDEWLKAIARWRHANEVQQADEQLKLFKQHYPAMSTAEIEHKLAQFILDYASQQSNMR